MAGKANKSTADARKYGPRKPQYVLVVMLDGHAYVSVESWPDREYAEFRAGKVEGSRVMQRGKTKPA